MNLKRLLFLLRTEPLIKDSFRIFFTKGPREFISRSINFYKLHLRWRIEPAYHYSRWLDKNKLGKSDVKKMKEEVGQFQYKPLISIIMPVYNVEKKWLDRAIRSVCRQIYPDWELCIVDDASTKSYIKPCLEKWQKCDNRIKVKYLEKNLGICGASNEALSFATGEFIGLLDDDDELTMDALYENVKLLNKNPQADFIYSDEDKINSKGERCHPYFKPDWSPDLLLSQMYTCHFTIYRKSLVNDARNFRVGYEGAQDWDLALRVSEKTDRIFHIPKVLYHWRMRKDSTAFSSTAKNYAYISAKKALSDAIKRRGIAGIIKGGPWLGVFNLSRQIIGNPLVTIIIPTKDGVYLLKKCINSIYQKTKYPSWEILIIDNNSKEPKTFNYFEKIASDNRIRIINYNGDFNFSKINNLGATHSKGEYLLFLNNDTEAINNGWLRTMLADAQREEVGAVGCKLLFTNNTIQHAGVILGINGTAGHVHKGLAESHPGYCGTLKIKRNFSAVTAACMMTRKKIFSELNGFDEVNFPTAFSDVDYCLRLREKGYLIVYTPYAKLYHRESRSRGYFLDEKDVKTLHDRWGHILLNDPYYNPNLTLEREDFSLRI